MRIALIVAILVSGFSELYSQRLIAAKAKGAYYKGGEKLLSKKRVKTGTKIEIAEGGELWLEYGKWNFSLGSGTYDIDSVVNASVKFNLKKDSIYNILKSQNLLNCREANALRCLGAGPFDTKKIEKLEISLTTPLELSWKREGFEDLYYVIITNIFDEYIYLESTRSSSTKIDLLKLKPNIVSNAILCKIVSTSCEASNTLLIAIK
jgi:hypothetical protein